MRLLFPNDEHEPVTLGAGTTLVGSGADCDVRLTAAGVAEHHCELVSEDGATRARPLTDSAATVLNGKQIVGEATLRAGDLLLFAKVGCRIVASAAAAPRPAAIAPAGEEDDPGHTRVRMALPKFILRGVSGPTFGKVYAMVGTLSVGRSAEADICIPIEEISRQHARLQSAATGLVVEDLGSANGTYVNDQRVHTPTLLKPGDEVRFDTVRFLLVSPAQEAAAASQRPPVEAAAPASGSGSALWIVAGIVVVAALALAVLRHLGIV